MPALATALAIGAGFILGLRVGIAWGKREERARARTKTAMTK